MGVRYKIISFVGLAEALSTLCSRSGQKKQFIDAMQPTAPQGSCWIIPFGHRFVAGHS